MRKRLSIVGAATALMLAPMGFGGGSSAQAMTCVAEPPVDTACAVLGGVIGLVCHGRLPAAPDLPVTTSAAMAWPIDCPPLG